MKLRDRLVRRSTSKEAPPESPWEAFVQPSYARAARLPALDRAQYRLSELVKHHPNRHDQIAATQRTIVRQVCPLLGGAVVIRPSEISYFADLVQFGFDNGLLLTIRPLVQYPMQLRPTRRIRVAYDTAIYGIISYAFDRQSGRYTFTNTWSSYLDQLVKTKELEVAIFSDQAA